MKNENLEKIIRLRHKLHRDPELSLQERKTGELLRRFLSEHTSLEIHERDGWFYAVRRGSASGSGSIAFRADMDALPVREESGAAYASENPGISHACGHDGHCAALCGLALELDRIEPAGTIYLIFQPAEEIGAGGKLCAELIREKGIGEVYAFHNLSGYPEGHVVYRKGLTQPASEGLEVRFTGKPSHASAPEDGCNPSEAIAATVLFALQLNEKPHCGMALCTVTGIRAGSGDYGISAGEGAVRMTLRAESEEEMQAMEQAVLAFAGERAGAAGVKTAYLVSDYFPGTQNHETGIKRVLEAAGTLGISACEMPELWRASEDFGYYLKECPGAMFYIGNGETWPALHTTEYDFNDRILETAVDMFLALCGSRPHFRQTGGKSYG